MTPLLSFVAKSGAGKTTFIEKLIPQLKQRGLRVAVVKHHAHTSSVDSPGKDTWRFGEAGADIIAVSSPAEFVRFQRVTRELTLAEIAARIENVDLILTEGFKREPAPKIEISRAELGTDLVARTDELIAVVSNHPIALDVPQFDLNDAPGLATFICAYFNLSTVD
jgi:molybdopterin-guanine dinucleotide biosynthesis protein B